MSDIYSLFQQDLLPKVAERPQFIPIMAYNYELIARSHGCTVEVSEKRLIDAFDFYSGDITRVVSTGIAQPSTGLDHFKHAAFIAFWLRRMIPINNTFADLSAGANVPGLHVRQRAFYRVGNEICALFIGYQICLNYVLGQQFDRLKGHTEKQALFLEKRIEYMKLFAFPKELQSDYVMIMKHKNLSPYSFLIMYRSLFSRSAWELEL